MKVIKVLEHIKFSGKSYFPGDEVSLDTFGKDTQGLLGTKSKENPFGTLPAIAYAEQQMVAVVDPLKAPEPVAEKPTKKRF